MSGFLRAVRVTFRSLGRSPGFTVPALLILAIGMTAATAVFTVVDSIVFRPLRLPDSGRLVIICEEHPRLQGYCVGSPGNTEDIRRATHTLSDVGIGRSWPYSLSDGVGSRGISGGLATAGFLRALGARPVLGRLYTDADHGPDHDKMVVLSHAFWTTRYGADPGIIGRTIQLDGEPYEVIGVLQEGFQAPFDMAGVPLWKPLHFDPLDPEVRSWRGFRVIGRLAPGATLAGAGEELRGIYAGIARAHPDAVNDEWHLRVTSLLDVVVGDTRPVLFAFLGAATLLLLIVCANVANLLLARGLGRRRELAVRAALGAERGRLVRGILGESLVLTGLATVLAVGLAEIATRLFLRWAPPMPRLNEVALDGRVLAFAALVSVMVTAFFALLPALRVTAWDLAQTIKTGGTEAEARTSARLRSVLVAAELALSLVLLGSAGILTRSFARYMAWDPGFDRSHLLAVSAFANTGKYSTREQLFSMWRQAETRVAAVPGVRSVATASAGPLFGGGDGATPYEVDGADASGTLPSVWWFDVGPGYFHTLGVPVVQGREITEADGLGVEPVAVVNRAMARAAWPGQSAVGRSVQLPELQHLTVRVVGVVADVQPLTPGQPPHPEIYWSNRQLGRPFTYFLVRTSGDPAALAKAVSGALLDVDPDLSLGTPRPLASAEARMLVLPRFQMLVILVFALAALALSAVGVYAVVSYSVARRVREMGIRMAIGASSSDVVGLVFRSSMAIAFIGVAVGLVGAMGAGRVLRSVAHGVSPTDPLSLAGAALLLLVVAAAAALAPARRATRADPLRALRAE
ncbi:MAG: ABC transporter permease [Gemmatimonadetes bacterium]|nr:ABC transporter permease [Gemmatimonadota bacterium]